MRNLVVRGAVVAAFALSAIAGSALLGGGTTPASAADLDNCKDCLFGVTSGGVKLKSRGVKKVERLNVGEYRVTFKKTVEGCALLATVVNLPNEPMLDAYISATLTSDPKVVYYNAYTADPNGHETVDVTFTGALICL
jgi:hypothetical protein